MGLHMGDVSPFAGGIHYDKNVIATIGEHQIIHDAALIVGEHSVTLTIYAKTDDINGDQTLQRLRRTCAADLHLPHMAYVKQASFLAGVNMFFHHTQRILHRHRVTRERHHFRTKAHMQIM